MQQAAAHAYGRTSQQTTSPRELEASLLIKAAAKLQTVRDEWAERKEDLEHALTYNRKLWSVFVGSVTDEDNPLPDPIKQNIRNLGLFVFNHTIQIQISGKPELLTPLVTINREIAAGLRGRS